MYINDEAVLKSAISSLSTAIPGVKFAPASQDVPAEFPCAIVGVRSSTASIGIADPELLANLTITISVFADSQYETGIKTGVLTIFGQINGVMAARGFNRANQTEPYYSARCRKWCKDGNFTKKSNEF